MTYPPERLAKLPLWAQRHIGQLARRLEEAHKTIEQQAGEESTNVVLDEGYQDGKESLRNAPDNVRVKFYLGDQRHHFIDVRRACDGGSVYVLGSEGLMISPHSSNTLSIEVNP